MNKWMNLAAGSLAGGFARYWIAGAVYNFFGAGFPYGTLIVNLSGCLAIGFFSALAEDKMVLGPDARMLLMTGFCGAYTTFSTFILETSNLLKDREIFHAAANIVLSVLLGLILFRIGVFAGKAI